MPHATTSMAATRRFGYTSAMEPTADQIADIVQQALNAAAPQTVFAVLFGSCARATMRPFSDIDIGLFFDHEPDLLTLGDIAGRIEAHAGRPVDIVLLRGLAERDPEFAFNIADEGVLLRESRPHAFAAFKKEAFLYYLDTVHLRRITREALHRRVLSGNMGRRNYV